MCLRSSCVVGARASVALREGTGASDIGSAVGELGGLWWGALMADIGR
jgi:hypothetical protein